ncbi:magnesium transporter [Blastococcus sp. CCUG 61487]|uniref:magnesium transporter n=1 Tax=Blastococcus sp. CCUG 61487 TaxID=1840703 RepID=UPI0010C14FD2|nr:magnesium transporter [Blastococcus sp. CCUG 61487]TKJ18423.1 magnesium transporter [Blastococcus sp. CCUG 61487]
MDQPTAVPSEQLSAEIERLLDAQDLTGAAAALAPLTGAEAVGVLERLAAKERAVLFRLLSKDTALDVFERLDPTLQGDLVQALQHEEVASVFASLEPDDRVTLLDELPATVATRLLQGLPAHERELTAEVLGYPAGSIGRRMSPEYVTTHPHLTVGRTLDRVRDRLADAETVYTLPVVDDERRLVGVVSLRDLIGAAPEEPISALLRDADSVAATEDAEAAARRCADLRHLALPVVDAEDRLVGILTVDDALAILEHAESEDQARIGGAEPLRRPYLSTPIRSIVRSRVVWLLVLAVGATLTVQVLSAFQATLEQKVVLSLFIPLLIGTGGNTGNQAATTVTRALALDDVRTRDITKVAARELRVGLSLGLLLGVVGFVGTALAFEPSIGVVIGLTLLSSCTLAATVGGAMPLIGRMIRVDPAVFSNPFITTFVDAAGLVVYFLIAKAVLGL